MLKGCDISRYQNTVDYDSHDFIIMKATEGSTYQDPMLDTHYDIINGSNNGKPNTSKLYGFYHYARPENNNYKDEVYNFLNSVGHHAGNCIYALDWEGRALTFSASWAKAWMDLVYQETGVKPVIYLQASEEWTGKYNSIRDADYGLWIAHWNGKDKPTVKNWPVWAFWQYTDKPYDLDYFNGTREQFKKYCERV